MHHPHLTFDLHRHYGKKIRYTTCTKPKSIKQRWGLLRLRRLQRPLRMTHKGVSVHVRHNGYGTGWMEIALKFDGVKTRGASEAFKRG